MAMAVVVMTFVIAMAFVIIMIIAMVVVVIIVVAMIFIMVIVMIFFMIVIMVIVMTIMILLIIIMVIVVIIDMNLAVEMFSFSPNQSGSNGSFERERTAITKAPFKDAAKHAIDGVMLGIPLKVGVKSTMAFDGDDGREVEFTGFKGFSRSTMGAMGFGRRNGCERAQEKSQQSKA